MRRDAAQRRAQGLPAEEHEVRRARELQRDERRLGRDEQGGQAGARGQRPDGLAGQTPSAVYDPALRPPSIAFRTVSAVSCPGVTITSAQTPRKVASSASTSRV